MPRTPRPYQTARILMLALQACIEFAHETCAIINTNAAMARPEIIDRMQDYINAQQNLIDYLKGRSA